MVDRMRTLPEFSRPAYGFSIAAALFLPADAAAGNASGQVLVSGRVPVICELALSHAEDPAAAVVQEFCNAPRGFQVLVRHDPALGGKASFTYGGRTTTASPTGLTLVYASDSATSTRRTLRISGADPARLGRLGLSIRPFD